MLDDAFLLLYSGEQGDAGGTERASSVLLFVLADDVVRVLRRGHGRDAVPKTHLLIDEPRGLHRSRVVHRVGVAIVLSLDKRLHLHVALVKM
jgi:hypothetical protein